MQAWRKVYIAWTRCEKMKEANIEAGLRQLSESLRRIRSLVAWAELLKAEARPHTPPSMRIDHGIEADLRVQVGLFMKTSMDLREVLLEAGKEGVPEEALSRWKKRLLKLEAEFSKLDLSDRFIKL